MLKEVRISFMISIIVVTTDNYLSICTAIMQFGTSSLHILIDLPGSICILNVINILDKEILYKCVSVHVYISLKT